MTVPLTAGAGLGVDSQGSAIISAPPAGDLAMGRGLGLPGPVG